MLTLSSLGMGTYLGAIDDATDEQVLSALLYSVTRGWNVIDTGASALRIPHRQCSTSGSALQERCSSAAASCQMNLAAALCCLPVPLHDLTRPVPSLWSAAASYRDGRAEATVGRALMLLLVGSSAMDFPEGRAEVPRDALFISSKAGYLSSGACLSSPHSHTAGTAGFFAAFAAFALFCCCYCGICVQHTAAGNGKAG